jgi:hypothetical protein
MAAAPSPREYTDILGVLLKEVNELFRQVDLNLASRLLKYDIFRVRLEEKGDSRQDSPDRVKEVEPVGQVERLGFHKPISRKAL